MPLKQLILTRLSQLLWLGLLTLILSVIAGASLRVFAAFTEPSAAPAASNQDFTQNILGANNADNAFDSSLVTASSTGSIIERLEYLQDAIVQYPGRGWTPNPSGDGSVALTQAACEAAADWEWFEDGNGDGDTTDPEDGICVQAANLGVNSNWNGNACSSVYENSYIAAYTCAGSFPSGYVATYSGRSSGCAADNTYNDGDCALCKADCYDGKKDLPDQGGWTTPNGNDSGGVQGPLTVEALKNWKGTRLPTMNDFFGFCGATSGDADNTAGDGLYHSSGASASKTIGRYGNNVGRGANGAPFDEYIDLSNMGSNEWLSEQVDHIFAQIAGYYACSYSYYFYVHNSYRSRAVFRP